MWSRRTDGQISDNGIQGIENWEAGREKSVERTDRLEDGEVVSCVDAG